MIATEVGPVSNGAASKIDMDMPYVAEFKITGVADLLFHRWNCEAVAEKSKAAKGSKAKKTDDVVTKWDGAENTDVEAVKGGLSDSMKRAAVQWGIGRYLYQLEEGWAETSLEKRNGWERANAKKNKDDKQGVTYYWTPPKLPIWALPADRPNGTAPRTTPPPQDPPAKLSPKDAKLVATFCELLAEATTQQLYDAAMEMLKREDSGVSKAENVQQVKREIFEVMKKHPLYVPPANNQAA